jgi:tRNA dimethylallyltransferase
VIDNIELPGQWPDVRAELDQDAELLGTPALHARLDDLDPLAASRMEPSNSRRVVRALEVCVGSGRPFSSFGPGLDVFPPSPVTQLGLRGPRVVLAQRIERRVLTMIASGLVDEVSALLDRPISRTARQALGYKELIEHVEGRCTLDAAVAMIVTGTRQLAVRQERWFRRDPRVRWIDIEADPVAEALPAVLDALAR